jgi:uncharacterized protein YegP (UPF0339 family)
MALFHIYKNGSAAQPYHFNLKDESEIILTGETYASKQGAKNGIASVRENAKLRERFEIKVQTNNKYYFVLKAANHEPLGFDREYDSIAECETAIQRVMRLAPDACTIDETGEGDNLSDTAKLGIVTDCPTRSGSKGGYA